MVKGIDFTQTDPTKKALDYIFGFLENPFRISLDDAHKHLLYWLKHSTSTSTIYQSFQQLEIKPKINLQSKCYSYPDIIPQHNDSTFPASQQGHEITLCMNHIKNKIQLKENLDRQLYIMYMQETLKQEEHLNTEQKTMKSLYEGCLQGYKNYGFQSEILKKMSKKCATYLFRRRTSSELPYDTLFRYCSKMADDICQ